MSKKSFVNGKYLNFQSASIPINDRSIHFSDAVYEVVAVHSSKLVFWQDHLDRLKKSLNYMEIKNFKNIELLKYKCKEIIKLNSLDEGLIYIQISRGIAPRNHNWHNNLIPSLIISCLHKRIFQMIKPVNLISNEDIRWKYSKIKSTSLLGNVLLKQKALKEKAFECLMIDDKGYITEATTSNIWIIKDKKLYTPPLKKNILAGVTRKKVFELADILKLKSYEKEIKLKSLINSDGVFLTNSSSLLVKVKKINDFKLKLDRDGIFELLYKTFLQTIREANE